MIHLDTSFLIGALNRGSIQDRSLRRWVEDGETLAMSAVAWSEFLCGPLTLAELGSARQIIGTYREFTPDHAAVAARLFCGTGRRRGSLPDCMIAAVAMADSASIATANEADFRRFEDAGLIVVS